MATSEAAPFLLTPIDNAMPRRHVPIILFFPEPESPGMSAAANTLRHGLSKLLEGIPLFSGTVKATGQRGGLCVTAPWSTIQDIFQMKDLSHESGLDYQDLKSKQFPLEELGNLAALLPVAGMMKSEPPVILVQLNIIKGGMIMAMCVHHSFTDGNGTIAIARLWAAYCRGEDGSRLVTSKMIDRKRLMRGWGSASLADVSEFTMMPTENQGSSGGIFLYIRTVVSSWLMRLSHWLTARFGRWIVGTKNPDSKAPSTESQRQNTIFFFSKSKLVELKRMASVGKKDEDGEAWISTNDALCALVGCSLLSSVDHQVDPMADQSYTVEMVVEMRRTLNPPLPADYIGNILNFVNVSVSSQSIVSTPANVSEMAYALRNQITQRDERYVRKLIAALSSVGDLAKVIATPPSPSEDKISFSSWANQGFYDINWGDAVGVRIERTRAPSPPTICIIMPELSAPNFTGDECGLEAVINLKKGEMERLKQNELFMRFAQWRCN